MNSRVCVLPENGGTGINMVIGGRRLAAVSVTVWHPIRSHRCVSNNSTSSFPFLFPSFPYLTTADTEENSAWACSAPLKGDPVRR